MANLNEKTKFIAGRNPLAADGRPPFARPEQTEAALWLTNGDIAQDKSGAAEYTGDIRRHGVIDFKLDSDQPRLNAVVVSGGTSSFLNPDIQMSGPGCSDFTCKGTGILAMDGAHVDIRNGEIVTHGATRAATIATTGATLKVFDSKLATYGGPLPEDYVPVIGPGMMEPPAPLGLGGNCRTHLSMDNSESYFYNCDIYGEAWAALSTDASGGYVYLEANDSRVQMNGNGYIVYADNGCHVVLNRCEISSGNVFGIQDGNSSIQFRNVTGSCKGYGFLIHGGMPDLADIGAVRIQDSSLQSVGPMFRCKSTNVDLYLKNSSLVCTDGTILQTMLTDDEHYARNRTQGFDQYGVQVTFESMELCGDMRCDDPERKTCLNLVDTVLTGVITGSPLLQLTEGSSWTATGNSAITLVGTPEGIDASAGITITAKSTAVAPGIVQLPSGGVLEILA